MPRDVEARPSTGIEDVLAITAGDGYLTAKGLDPPIGFAEAWQVNEAGCYLECSEGVTKPSSIGENQATQKRC